jgi:hypothetical protein
LIIALEVNHHSRVFGNFRFQDRKSRENFSDKASPTLIGIDLLRKAFMPATRILRPS